MLHTLPVNLSPIGDQEIKSLKVVCSNSESGCDWVGELQSLDDHLTTCGYTLLRCPNECMENNEEVRMLRRDLDQHLKNKCPNRQYQCPHCEDTGRYRDITTTHLDTCPQLKTCSNNGCNVKVSQKYFNILDHWSECQFEKVPCKYASIGCKEEPLRKDLERHENDTTLHLPLAIETVCKQQEEIEELREEVKAVKEEQKIDVIGDTVDSCVFKFPEFDQHYHHDKEWYSPPFYTHPGGYKMCINVEANGDDDGRDTYVSVYAYLMKGKNDDNLPWPFTGEVTITLLNQLEDENHHTDTVSFPENSVWTNERVVNHERAPEGCGWDEFISHDELDFDAENNRQYLKDDCLFFKIEVEAAQPVKPWLTCTA